jgi:DMSO reductase anchor subunit
MKRIPAVLSSVLGQASVGAFWALLVVRAWVAGLAGPHAARRLTDPSLRWVAAGAALALLGALTDLFGAQTGIPRAQRLRGLLWTALFLGAVAASAAAVPVVSRGPGWEMAAEVAASASGLLLLWHSSSIYSSAGIAAWKGWTTPALFFVTAFQTGVLGATAALVPGDASDELAGTVYGYLALWGLCAVLAGILLLGTWLRRLTLEGGLGAERGRRFLEEHRRLLTARAALSGAAALACALAVLWDRAVGPAALAGAGLAFASEFCGRALFMEAGSLGRR